MTSWELRFTPSPSDFLTEAADLLTRDPISGSVVASIAQRTADRLGSGGADAQRDLAHLDGPDGHLPAPWYCTVRDGGQVVSAAMRTMPRKPYAAFVMAMPDDAARALADALIARDEILPAANGALPATRVVMDAMAEHAGGSVTTAMHTRLFECREVVPPSPAAGRLRRAREVDVELCAGWYAAFHRDADEQAGRTVRVHDDPDPELIKEHIAAGVIYLWEVDGVPVHLTSLRDPAMGASRIGPVYTPPEHRGRGYAANAVAQLTQHALDTGSRPCLYTDQANPVSNKVYERIGYRPVVDEVELRLEP